MSKKFDPEDRPWPIIHLKDVGRKYIRCQHCGSHRFLRDTLSDGYQMTLFPRFLRRPVEVMGNVLRLRRLVPFMLKHWTCAVIYLEGR